MLQAKVYFTAYAFTLLCFDRILSNILDSRNAQGSKGAMEDKILLLECVFQRSAATTLIVSKKSHLRVKYVNLPTRFTDFILIR